MYDNYKEKTNTKTSEIEAQHITLTAWRRQFDRRLDFSSSTAEEQEAWGELWEECWFSMLLNSWLPKGPKLKWDWHPLLCSSSAKFVFLFRDTLWFPFSKSHLDGSKSPSSKAKGSWLSSRSSILVPSEASDVLEMANFSHEPLLDRVWPFEHPTIPLLELFSEELDLIFKRLAFSGQLVVVSEMNLEPPKWMEANCLLFWDRSELIWEEVHCVLQHSVEELMHTISLFPSADWRKIYC